MAQRASWHVPLSIPENRTQKHTKQLTFPEIFKNESFRFSQFSRNFVLKKFPCYGSLGLLTCSSIDPRKLYSKIPKTHFYSTLKLTFPEIFKNGSFRFSQYSQFFFFATYALTEAFWNQLVRLLKNFNEILEKLPVFLKELCRHYNVTLIYCHLRGRSDKYLAYEWKTKILEKWRFISQQSLL